MADPAQAASAHEAERMSASGSRAPDGGAPERRRVRMHWRTDRRRSLGATAFTVLLLGLIALSIEAVAGDLAFVLLASVALVAAAFHWMFPGSGFFTIALANFIGIYASVFVLFAEANFRAVGVVAQTVGFVLPLLAFVGGAWWRRREIRSIVTSERLRGARPNGIFLWLVPIALIGALTFLVPQEVGRHLVEDAFLLSMFAISGVVLFVSRDIAVFLLDAGILFEGFFEQVARMVVPAFAFLTFYSLLVIVFASVYTIMDRVSPTPHFVMNGTARDITYSESLYFSVVTLSTVGYGDIQPHSGPIRLVATAQIVSGVLLLLFGFSAIITHRGGGGRGGGQ